VAVTVVVAISTSPQIVKSVPISPLHQNLKTKNAEMKNVEKNTVESKNVNMKKVEIENVES